MIIHGHRGRSDVGEVRLWHGGPGNVREGGGEVARAHVAIAVDVKRFEEHCMRCVLCVLQRMACMTSPAVHRDCGEGPSD